MAGTYALVLTGDLLPGFAPEAAWPQLAAYFRMEPQKLAQLVAHAPRILKQDGDFSKLKNLQEGMAQAGAEAEICNPDARPALYVRLNDDTPRGPAPRTLVEKRVQLGRWPETVFVAEAGAQTWHTFREYDAVINPAPPPQQQPAAPTPDAAASAFTPASASAPLARAAAARADDDNGNPALAAARYRAAGKAQQTAAGWGSEEDAATPQPARAWRELPAGPAIHAGFWRRCAAFVLDYLLFTVIILVACIPLFFIAAIGGAFAGFSIHAHGVSNVATGTITAGLISLFWMLLLLGVAFWYFPWKESSDVQATFGKRAMGIKVVDMFGERIGLLRSIWRYLSMCPLPFILLGVLLAHFSSSSDFRQNEFSGTDLSISIGLVNLIAVLPYLLAGWTRRKRTLYDMLAGVCVVFDDVQPGQRLPRQRPSMPWYGWVINILLILWIGGPAVAFMTTARERSERTKMEEVVTAVSTIQDEVIQQGCQTGERSLPDPALGKAEVTGGLLGVCKITLTLANSADMPAALRGGTIELTRQGRGQWRCASSLPEKYLPPGCGP